MTYIDLTLGDRAHDALHPASSDVPPALDGFIGFSAQEWDVILLGQRDRLSSIAPPPPLAWLWKLLFGSRPSLRLANPRLEALRRMVVLIVRGHGKPPAGEIAAFQEAGFTHKHFVTLMKIVQQRASADWSLA